MHFVLSQQSRRHIVHRKTSSFGVAPWNRNTLFGHQHVDAGMFGGTGLASFSRVGTHEPCNYNALCSILVCRQRLVSSKVHENTQSLACNANMIETPTIQEKNNMFKHR